MKPEEIKTRLRDEMADLAPDCLEDLLAACDAQPQEHAPQPVPMLAPRRPVWKPLAAAAVFVLLLGGIFGYRALDKNVCTVIVDINPSVTLTVNRLGRVKAMDTGNAAAAALLADVGLAGARTQDALGTLTDALADADYLTDADNTLLVTVEGASAARAQKLGRAVYDAAQASAQQRQFSAAVLCQQAADAEQTRTDADAWQVSPGKAALAETIANLPLSLAVKAEEGKLFGTVTATDLAEALAAKGINVDWVVKYNIGEDSTCEDANIELAEEGCELIFNNSYGFEPFMLKVAPDYPEIQFVGCTNQGSWNDGLENTHNAFANIYEGRYLAGVVAGMKMQEMIDNGDIDDTNKELIVEHMDSTIYKAALDALIERGENKDFYEKLAAEYAKHNTLGI